MFTRFMLVMMLLCAGAGASAASGYYADGFQEDGYTYRAGYWWSGDQPYTRARIDYYEPYTYSYCGRYYTQQKAYWYWKYSKAYDASTVSPKDPDFRTKLLEIAKQRDRIEGEIRKSAAQHNEFLEAVQVLGLQGNFEWKGYGTAPLYASPQRAAYGQSLQYGQFGNNASTIFGYSQLTEAYNTLDPNILFQQSASLTKGAQSLAGQANSEFNTSLDKAIRAQGRAAEIVAQGIASERALIAARAAPQSSTTTTVTQPGPVAPPEPVLPPDQEAPPVMPKVVGGRVPFPAAADCMACHSGAKVEGRFDVTTWWGLPEARRRVIIRDRLLTDDMAKLMPRKPDGGAHRLPPGKLKQFMEK